MSDGYLGKSQLGSLEASLAGGAWDIARSSSEGGGQVEPGGSGEGDSVVMGWVMRKGDEKTTTGRANGAHTCQARRPLLVRSDTNPDLSPPTTSSPMTETQSTTADPPPLPSETHSYTIVTPTRLASPIAIEQVNETAQRQRERHARRPPHTTHRTARGVSRERDRAGPGPARGVSSETSSRT